MRELTHEEKEKIEKLSKELRSIRAKCSQYCPVWNSFDKDCEIYGSMHVPPSRCAFYLKQEVLK